VRCASTGLFAPHGIPARKRCRVVHGRAGGQQRRLRCCAASARAGALALPISALPTHATLTAWRACRVFFTCHSAPACGSAARGTRVRNNYLFGGPALASRGSRTCTMRLPLNLRGAYSRPSGLVDAVEASWASVQHSRTATLREVHVHVAERQHRLRVLLWRAWVCSPTKPARRQGMLCRRLDKHRLALSLSSIRVWPQCVW